MDYMQMELTRQRTALAALLSGAEKAERETASRRGDAADAEKGAFAREGGSALEASDLRAAWRGAGAHGEIPANGSPADFPAPEPGSGSRRQAGTEPTEDEWARLNAAANGAAVSRAAALGATADRELAPAEAGAGPSAFARETAARTPAGGGEGGVSQVRFVTEVTAPAAAFPAAGARALSLAVQRDARRYDGGFSLY